MSFRLVKDPSNSHMEYVPVSTLALSAGDCIELNVGAAAWTIAASTTEHWERKAIASEDVATAVTEAKVWMVNPQQVWEADTGSNSSSSHNGDRMVLTNENSVNNSGTDNAAEEANFLQIAPVGAAADKTIIGRFLGGTGVNPDAA